MKRVPEPWLRELIRQIVYHNPKDNVIVQSPQWKFNLLPSYKSLWNCPSDKGLPIGNLTSQFFSNVYLDVLDQFVKHELKCKYYCRYVDDFVIMDESPERLNYCYNRIAEFISQNLLIVLHKDKKTINLVSNGIDFVGYVAKPNRFYLRQRTLRDIFRMACLGLQQLCRNAACYKRLQAAKTYLPDNNLSVLLSCKRLYLCSSGVYPETALGLCRRRLRRGQPPSIFG